MSKQFCFFANPEKPTELFVVIDGKPIFYKAYPSEEIAKAVADGLNKTNRRKYENHND